jgi:hypothetical protein
MIAVAGVVTAVVSLPLIVCNIPAYVHSAVTLQFQQPFRADALSLSAWWYSHGHAPPPNALAFLAAVAAIALSLWRAPHTPAGFAAAVAVVYYAFLAFNKQAFCNYYFFVVGALCCALAASASQGEGAIRHDRKETENLAWAQAGPLAHSRGSSERSLSVPRARRA